MSYSQQSAQQLQRMKRVTDNQTVDFSREVIEPAHVRRLKGVQEAWLEATEVSFARFPDLPPQLRIRIWTLFCYMHGRFPKRTICREKLYSGTSKPSGPQI